jgi:glycosyltransferase involved in cell wall biosynthesis
LEDGFNLPIVEAMACGPPVIASLQAGSSELIRDAETGFILAQEMTNANNLEVLARMQVALTTLLAQSAFWFPLSEYLIGPAIYFSKSNPCYPGKQNVQVCT